MATNIPLTIQCSCVPYPPGKIVFGTNNLSISASAGDCYWVVVVDRTDLTIVQNFTFSDSSDVPPALVPYQDNSQYMMILTSNQLISYNLPTGDFYNFLVSVGAGPALQNLEQIYTALGSGYWTTMAYTLVAVFDSSAGYEYSDYQNNVVVNTLTLIPVQVGSGVLYTPVELQ